MSDVMRGLYINWTRGSSFGQLGWLHGLEVLLAGVETDSGGDLFQSNDRS
jgi:hypothetical protein